MTEIAISREENEKLKADDYREPIFIREGLPWFVITTPVFASNSDLAVVTIKAGDPSPVSIVGRSIGSRVRLFDGTFGTIRRLEYAVAVDIDGKPAPEDGCTYIVMCQEDHFVFLPATATEGE